MVPARLTSVQAKGYPDLVTHCFLQRIHQWHPEIPILVLADFDPDGLKIFRCYRLGPDTPVVESAIQNRGVRWLGVKAQHIQHLAAAYGDSTTVQGSSDAGSRASISSLSCRDPVSMFRLRDRKLAACTLAKLSAQDIEDPELEQLQREFRVMLMMGVKAETQWLDDAGNLATWLDENMGSVLRPTR